MTPLVGSVIQVAGTTGDYGSSVLLNGVDRQLDAYLQTQLRTETSGAAYADIRSTFLQNLPAKMSQIASLASYGSWLNFFMCDALVSWVKEQFGPDPTGVPVTAARCKR